MNWTSKKCYEGLTPQLLMVASNGCSKTVFPTLETQMAILKHCEYTSSYEDKKGSVINQSKYSC